MWRAGEFFAGRAVALAVTRAQLVESARRKEVRLRKPKTARLNETSPGLFWNYFVNYIAINTY
jgi:hypothetical protein